MARGSDSPVAVGEVLAGKYRVERVIGVGGMGVVVQAMHLDLDRRVALKFMLVDVIGHSADAVARFLREGRAAAMLQSEHVARVMDVGRLETGEPYMVMEFLEGQDLSDVLREHGPLSVERAVSYVLQACEAIAEAHAAGIVHRDLKPSNLFLSQRSDGTPLVKVLDFGISKVVRPKGEASSSAGITSTQAILGSPAYMSPEQVRSSKNVDARTDIWALGIILYEMLTCRSPFEGESVAALIAAIASDSPVSIMERRPDLPSLAGEVVMRCLHKDPAKRFASVAELANGLQPLASPDDALLVSRIVRVQRTAGLTQLDTTRPPALSASDSKEAPANQVSATAATFGVTARNSRGKNRQPWKWVFAGSTLTLVIIGGTTAWWVARSPMATATSTVMDGGEASKDMPIMPGAPSITAPANPAKADGAASDAGAEAASDSQPPPSVVASALPLVTAGPKSAHPKTRPGSETGTKNVPRNKTTAPDPVVDLSERR